MLDTVRTHYRLVTLASGMRTGAVGKMICDGLYNHSSAKGPCRGHVAAAIWSQRNAYPFSQQYILKASRFIPPVLLLQRRKAYGWVVIWLSLEPSLRQCWLCALRAWAVSPCKPRLNVPVELISFIYSANTYWWSRASVGVSWKRTPVRFIFQTALPHSLDVNAERQVDFSSPQPHPEYRRYSGIWREVI